MFASKKKFMPRGHLRTRSAAPTHVRSPRPPPPRRLRPRSRPGPRPVGKIASRNCRGRDPARVRRRSSRPMVVISGVEGSTRVPATGDATGQTPFAPVTSLSIRSGSSEGQDLDLADPVEIGGCWPGLIGLDQPVGQLPQAFQVHVARAVQAHESGSTCFRSPDMKLWTRTLQKGTGSPKIDFGSSL